MSAARETPSEPPLERWLRAHAEAVALTIVALGLLARLRAARSPVWIPDETYHLQIAGAPGLWEMYRMSLGNAHPPLFMLLLRGWLGVVSTPWSLRLLPVAFGTAFLWAAYRWARSAFGTAAAFSLLVLLSFLPSFVVISAELRGYSLMLWLIAASLASLERALDTGSPRALALFGLCGALALLTHYAGLWLLLGAFVYGSVRMWSARSSPTRRFVVAWLGCGAAIGALFGALYVTHIAHLHGNTLERDAQDRWLRASYFQPGGQNPLVFVARQTGALFHFLFSTPVAGWVAMALFFAGLVTLISRRRPSVILVLLPFLASAAAALLGLYPYGGTRHSIGLGLLACASIGVATARITRERLWVPLLLGAALAPASFALGW